MGIFKKTVLPGIIAAFLYVYAGARFALDLVGWSTAPDDIGVAMSRADQLFGWLMSIPVWLPFTGAILVTIVLMMAARPMPDYVQVSSMNDPKLPADRPVEKLISSLYLDVYNAKGAVRSDLARKSDSFRIPGVVYTKLSVGVAAQVRSVLAKPKAFDMEVPNFLREISMSDGKVLVDYFDTILPFVGRNQTAELKVESSVFVKAIAIPNQ